MGRNLLVDMVEDDCKLVLPVLDDLIKSNYPSSTPRGGTPILPKTSRCHSTVIRTCSLLLQYHISRDIWDDLTYSTLPVYGLNILRPCMKGTVLHELGEKEV